MNCSPQLSQRFLRNELADEEQDRFESHLESCETCRRQLDAETDSEVDALALRRRLACSMEMPTWAPLDEVRLERDQDVSYAAEIAVLAPSDDPESLGRIGLFEARAIIGRGGMGTVFKAIDPALGRTVAIKVLRPDLASIGSARQRFALEARAMASIAHPHVVPIHAVDEHRGIPYMAMEYVPGGNLEGRLKKDGPFELLSVLRIAQQIASALESAHECGLVHRDIKPANILLDRGVDRVRVADFGLVRVSDDASMTRSGIIAGTPQYMAPEQVKGEACDRRSDLFSLGCVMYALLTGHPPFRADSPYAAMQRIVHDTQRPLLEWRNDIPDWLQCLIDRLLAKEPQLRFSSAGQVAELLEAELVYLQNPTRTERPDRSWMRALKRPATRIYGSHYLTSIARRWPLALACMLLIAGIASVPIGAWWLNSTPPSGVKSGGSSRTITITPPSTADIPLWTRDGYAELRILMDRWQSAAPAQDVIDSDGWWQAARSLEMELQRFEAQEP